MNIDRLEPRIIYSDDALLAADKPAGMPAISIRHKDENTLASWILKRFPEQAGIGRGDLEAGLIHRLDNGTSGVMIAARTNRTYYTLRSKLADGSIEKRYLALVMGIPHARGTIDTMIAHHPRKKKKMTVCETEDKAAWLKGRKAKTEYTVIGLYPSEEMSYALLFVSITTGVRHQIRAHLSSIGHPIAGDALYQNPRRRNEDILNIGRQFLHSYEIVFPHPIEGTRIMIKSPLPIDLRCALKCLKHRDHDR